MPRKGDGLSGRQLDVVIPGIGRLCVAWGTDKRKERAVRKALVFDLVRAGQLDVIRALKDGRVSWPELLTAKRAKRLDDDSLAADLSLAKELRAAFSATLPQMGKTDATRQSYREAFDSLMSHAADHFVTGVSVHRLLTVDWPAVWGEFAGLSPAWRNRVRSVVSAFLSVYLDDKFHEFARKVRKAMGAKEKEVALPQSVEAGEFWTVMAHVDPVLVPSYVTLAATGLRVSEYLALTSASLRRFPTIVLPTSKAGHEQTVEVDPALEPYVRAAVPCRLPRPVHKSRSKSLRKRDPRYYLLARVLKKAATEAGIPMGVHTLRHFFVAEGVKEHPQAFVQQAARHETAEMTTRYAKQRDTRAVAGTVGRALLDAQITQTVEREP